VVWNNELWASNCIINFVHFRLHIFDCKWSRLLLGQSCISFVALAGSLPHLTQISNEIKAIQKMRKLYCSTVSKVLNLDIKYLVVVMIFLTWINMPLHWWIYQILDYGGKHEGMQHQIPLKNSLRQNSSPKAPLQKHRSNTSWTGFLLCFTHYCENRTQIHLDHCTSHFNFVMVTTTWIYVFHFSYKPDCIFLSKLTHKAFSICTTIQKCAGFREMGQCHSKPKRRETYMFYTLIISAVSCRMMHETWGDSKVWRIEKPLAWENQCLVNRTFYTTWFYHHCGYITKI
jgi:hypothetical protein